MWTDSSHKIYCTLFSFLFPFFGLSLSLSLFISASPYTLSICIFWTWILNCRVQSHDVPLERIAEEDTPPNRKHALGRNLDGKFSYKFRQANVTIRICKFLHFSTFSCDCDDLSFSYLYVYVCLGLLLLHTIRKSQQNFIGWQTHHTSTYIDDFAVKHPKPESDENLLSKPKIYFRKVVNGK